MMRRFPKLLGDHVVDLPLGDAFLGLKNDVVHDSDFVGMSLHLGQPADILHDN